ncbi:hypothetical protein AAHB51_17840 [Bacillus cereus]
MGTKNKGDSSENNFFAMYSDGNDNKKNIFLELIPFDGRNSESAPSTNSSYDIRKSDYADPFFRFSEGYDENTSRRINITESNPLGWFLVENITLVLQRGKGQPMIRMQFSNYTFLRIKNVLSLLQLHQNIYPVTTLFHI